MLLTRSSATTGCHVYHQVSGFSEMGPGGNENRIHFIIIGYHEFEWAWGVWRNYAAAVAPTGDPVLCRCRCDGEPNPDFISKRDRRLERAFAGYLPGIRWTEVYGIRVRTRYLGDYSMCVCEMAKHQNLT